jgi:DNA-directed RNA polymerase subunit RPC12/RpoP
MKRVPVQGRNGAWDFEFTKRVPHGKGTRTVKIGVPVIQVLELADQFRACPGAPGHAVHHLSSASDKRACQRWEHERVLYYACSGCGCTARSTDVNPDLRCPTCGKESLRRLPEELVPGHLHAAALTRGELAVEMEKAARRIEGLEREVERLSGWLQKIDGGDNPCQDESKLRQWAYEAVVLNRSPQEAS